MPAFEPTWQCGFLFFQTVYSSTNTINPPSCPGEELLIDSVSCNVGGLQLLAIVCHCPALFSRVQLFQEVWGWGEAVRLLQSFASAWCGAAEAGDTHLVSPMLLERLSFWKVESSWSTPSSQVEDPWTLFGSAHCTSHLVSSWLILGAIRQTACVC